MWNYVRLSPSTAEVLDEGAGLGNLGQNGIEELVVVGVEEPVVVGVEEPVVVGADIGHGLRITFILRFAALQGSVLTIFSWFSLYTVVPLYEIEPHRCTKLYRTVDH